MHKGAVRAPIPIGQPVALVASDLERLRETRHVASTPQSLRDSHHMVARLAAMGLRPFKIAEQVGYSYVRVQTLLASPAMQELVAQYRLKVDGEFAETADAFFTLATSNMVKTERMIADALEDAEATGERPSLRTLDAISQGRQDRFGYGKKTQNLNINVDFAAQLEKAIKRSGKTIDGTPNHSSTSGPPSAQRRAVEHHANNPQLNAPPQRILRRA